MMPDPDKIYDWRGTPVRVRFPTYNNGRIAVELVETDGRPYTTLSTNLVKEEVEPGEFFCKNWSELEGSDQWLIDNGIAEHTGIRAQSGFVLSPLMRLTVPSQEESK